jgi:integrase
VHLGRGSPTAGSAPPRRPLDSTPLYRAAADDRATGFYDYGIHEAEVLTYFPVSTVHRPHVSEKFQATGLTSAELRRLLEAAENHSPRTAALVTPLVLRGFRIEALGADVRDYVYD